MCQRLLHGTRFKRYWSCFIWQMHQVRSQLPNLQWKEHLLHKLYQWICPFNVKILPAFESVQFYSFARPGPTWFYLKNWLFQDRTGKTYQRCERQSSPKREVPSDNKGEHRVNKGGGFNVSEQFISNWEHKKELWLNFCSGVNIRRDSGSLINTYTHPILNNTHTLSG